MKINKNELVKVIDRVKSVAQKHAPDSVLGGVLIKDGYAIAANYEMTIQVKLESVEGESLIIPIKAFDLIKNLPDGEVELTVDSKNTVTIQTENIKNSYLSFPAEEFIFDKTEVTAKSGIKLPGKLLTTALSHVLYAAADKSIGHQELESVYLESEEGKLNLAAADGHMVCWEQINASGVSDIKLLLPKAAAKKIASMGLSDEVFLSYDENTAIFETDKYIIRTRLMEGKYIPYQKMFNRTDSYTIIDREELIGAMIRAKMCTAENVPTLFDINNDSINVILRDSHTNYQETVSTQEPIGTPIQIAFNSRYVLETIKAFTCENITLNYSTPTSPMIVQAEDSDMKALVLPIRLGKSA